MQKIARAVCLLMAAVAAPAVAADTLASYQNYTAKEKARAIDAVAQKADVWLEDDQWHSMEDCMNKLVAKGPPTRELDGAISECFSGVVRSDQLF